MFASVKKPITSIRRQPYRRWVKIAGRFTAVMHEPPEIGPELGFHELTGAIGEINSIDQAGRLPAHGAGIAVIFCHAQFDIGTGNFQCNH